MKLNLIWLQWKFGSLPLCQIKKKHLSMFFFNWDFPSAWLKLGKMDEPPRLILSTNHFLTGALLVEVLGSWCVIGKAGSRSHTQRSHQTSRPVQRPSQIDLSSLTWPRKSISGSQECHYLATTRPHPTQIFNSVFNPRTPTVGTGIT